MNLYVILNLIVFSLPFVLSFDKKVAFHKRWLPLVLSILVVSTVYIIWDIVVTERGHWGFNKEYAGGAVLIGLPLGEILFFISVPYACIFIYEVVKAYFKQRTVLSPKASIILPVIGVVVFTVLGLLFTGRGYTMLAFFSVAAFFLLVLATDREMFVGLHTWLYFGISYVAFLAVNGVLTGLPVVVYGEAATTGVRVGPIPLEDFFYNFGLLGFYLYFFRAFIRRLNRRG